MYNIPSMPLDEALIEFGLQSQRSLLYSGLNVAGKQSNPVIGEMTEKQALKEMLRRTRLVGELTPRATVRLEPKQIVWPTQTYPRDSKNDERRADILETRDDVIRQLIAQGPDVLEDIEEAAGYAVFSSTGVNLVFVAAGGGRGVAHDNKTGRDFFMRMAKGGLGVGLGVKDFYGVFVFHERAALELFIDRGWDFSGEADAEAKSAKGGASVDGVVNGNAVSAYVLTDSAFTLQASLQGTKYWPYKRLNK
jgi:lipid-binding SYLF domain-containing protein